MWVRVPPPLQIKMNKMEYKFDTYSTFKKCYKLLWYVVLPFWFAWLNITGFKHIIWEKECFSVTWSCTVSRMQFKIGHYTSFDSVEDIKEFFK